MSQVIRQETRAVIRQEITKAVVPQQAGPVRALAGIPGPPGMDGQPGDITRISRPAAEPISGQRVVATDSNGDFIYADSSTPAHAQSTIGVTIGAAAQGDTATAIALGPLTENSWTWTPGSLIFLGTNGTLTQTAPSTGFVMVVAKAVTATTIFVNVQPAFNRS
jgi:hypothetical protein